MAVLLDTDHFSILQQSRDSAAPLKARLGQLPSGAINVCIISFQEQAKGWLAFIHRAKKQRMRIGTNDLPIAAIAKANAVKLLSRNLRDFRQVPQLDVEDRTA